LTAAKEKTKRKKYEEEWAGKTFTYFAQTYIEPKINKWQAKSESETINEWQQRVNETTRNAKIAELQQEAEQEYIRETAKDFAIGNMTLGTYDNTDGTFLIKNSVYGEWYLPVPYGREATDFKIDWTKNNIKKTPHFIISDDILTLDGMTFTTSNGKRYRYGNESISNYTATNITYNFEPVDIMASRTSSVSSVNSNSISSSATTQSKQNIPSPSTNTEKKSDVAVNIPITKIKNDNTLVLIIANEDYNYVSPAMFAKNDGETFKQYCIKTLGAREENVTYIPNATLGTFRREIRQLKDLAETYNGEANIIFYYAGHGFPDENSKTAYLIPVDGTGNETESAYRLDNLYKELSATSAKSVTIFLDACFSGTQRSGNMLVEARGIAIAPKPSTPMGNLVVFSAAEGDETALPYTEKGHGMFTYFLLKK
jgi:hypothetical protein